MATDALFGWDLTFKTVEKDIKRKSDVIIAFIHWNLTKRGFRSIGIGDEVRHLHTKDRLFYLQCIGMLTKTFTYNYNKSQSFSIHL